MVDFCECQAAAHDIRALSKMLYYYATNPSPKDTEEICVAISGIIQGDIEKIIKLFDHIEFLPEIKAMQEKSSPYPGSAN